MNKFEPNPIMKTDSYKLSQYFQYPKGTKVVSSYIEPRGGVYSHVVNFGMQRFINEYLTTVPTKDEVNQAARLAKLHGVPFNYDGWMALSELGYYPLEIESLPEGMIVPIKNCTAQIKNTHFDFAWLTSLVETQLLRAVWYCSTVATMSAHIREMLGNYGKQCGVDDANINFKHHNFGDRGATSDESAMLAGVSHLTSFFGTDCLASLSAIEYYYNTDFNETFIGGSIPASEHSTITSWGRDNEKDAYINMIKNNPGDMFACVSDSYNIWKALEMWKELEPMILDNGSTLVIRPDSGNPILTPQNVVKRCLELFGYYEVKGDDGKMYKVLPDHIRVIQGDGVNTESIDAICKGLLADGISIENIAFGMGGELVQKINRDTMKWAMKCSYIEGWDANNRRFKTDVYKDPIGTSHWDDEPSTHSFKRSKAGRLSVVYRNDKFVTVPTTECDWKENDHLQLVFLDGKLYNESNFTQIRERIIKDRHLIKKVG